MVGILLGYYVQLHSIWSLGLLIVALIGLAFTKGLKQTSFPFDLISFLTAMFLGVFIISIVLPKNQSNHYLNSLPNIEGQLNLKVTRVLKPNDFSYRYYANVQGVEKEPKSGEVILYQSKDSITKQLEVDDEILVHSIIQPIPKPLNPHQFDFKDYLEKQGVYGQVRISGNQFLLLKNPRKTVVGIASNFRSRLIEKLRKQDFREEELSVIQALLLGQRNDISQETYENYRNAGAVHILAVSGLHVGILLLLLQFLLRPLERLAKGRTIKLMLIISLLWSYAFVAGLSPSIVRAVTMFSCLAYALYLNRPSNTFNILAWSIFFILLFKPLFLFQVGFQMSYAAVFAIIWIYPKLQQYWRPRNWLVKNIWQLLSVSVAAQLGVLPISLFYFHQFPALFFISNLVIVPFLGIILGAGILVLGLSYFEVIPSFFVLAYDRLIGLMNNIISWVAQQEAFLFTNIPFDGIQLILGYVITLSLVITCSKPIFKNISIFLGSLVLFSGYLVYTMWSSQTKEQLWLLHQTRNTVLLHQNGTDLNIFSRDNENVEKLIKPYEIAERIKSVRYDSIKNHYKFDSRKVLIVDSLDIYGTAKDPDYVILTQSPKIHLERFLDSLQPQTILADGSNSKNYVIRWKETCRRRKLPFHYTGEKGAYILTESE